MPVTFETKDFEILNVSQCNGILAVYAEDDESNPGMHKLVAYPVNFIAVAKVTIRHMKDKGSYVRECEPATVRNEVIGIELIEGWFAPCEEACNFAGYCMEGEDISKAVGMLDIRKYPLSIAAPHA